MATLSFEDENSTLSPGPHLVHPLRGRKMVEMGEMADIGGLKAAIP
jgi:hypothetical protein